MVELVPQHRSVAGRALDVFVRELVAFRKRVVASAWCAENIILPAGKQETKSGPIDWGYTPYITEPLDCLHDPGVREIVMVMPTRSGKTFLLRMVFSFSIAGDPAPMLWIDSTVDKARAVSKRELVPLVEANHVLRARKPQNRHYYSTTDMLFAGAAFSMFGANSPAQVSGDTVKRILGNEVDKWQSATDKEASIIDLVRHRTESYDDERKHFFSSTPTTETGTIWVEYLRGDQRRFFVPCHACGEMQQLEWDHVKWDQTARLPDGKWDLAAVKAGAHYECSHCHALWDDTQRRAAVKLGQWRPTAVGEPGFRTYALNGLYGPLKANNFGALAVDFLSSRSTGFHTDRQDFWNSRMGLPWMENVTAITAEKFAALERGYLRGTLPDGWKADLLIMECDVQANRMPWVVRAYNWAGESYLVDHGNSPTWADLDAVQEGYRKLAPRSYVIIDINFEDRRAEVLEQIYRRSDRGWIGAEGFEKTKELTKLELANAFMGSRLQKEKMQVRKLVISLYDFKVEIEKRLTGEIKNWFTYQLPIAASETELADQREYYAQLADERRVPRKRKVVGKPAYEFKSRTGNNHYFDCEVYGLALFFSLARTRRYTPKPTAPADRRVLKIQQ